jgi:hypothetical protein
LDCLLILTETIMVLFLLCIKADLENVSSITLQRDANICFSVRNPLSDYETREKVVMNPSQTVEQEEGAREPPHHFSLKWEGSKKASIATILDEAGAKAALKKKKGVEAPRSAIADDSGQWVPLLAVECRGLEPYEFHPLGGEFVITSTGGTDFTEDIDLSEGDWADYDAENDESVGLADIQFKWEAV